MSGLAGWAGSAAPSVLDAMLSAIDYRGDTTAISHVDGASLGYRYWAGRFGKASDVVKDGDHTLVCAGTLSPPVASPGDELLRLLRDHAGFDASATLDGAFAFAVWDARRRELVLGRDPFGVRSLYYVQVGATLFFATELKQLLTIDALDVSLDASAIHTYLTFSFVPGEAVPVKGIRRLLPGHLLRFRDGRIALEPYFRLKESIDERYRDPKTAVRTVRRLGLEAVRRRYNGENEVGLFLSGGLDSSAVAVWLRELGISVRLLSLDFGTQSVEREQAALVAKQLDLPLTLVPVDAERIAESFWDIVYKLDLPFGDAVTGPQYLLGKAAREAGLATVFNGEGGDQLFGGWTSKPMVAAELYGGLYEHQDESREETYLRSYHRFYGSEERLYTREFMEAVGGPGQRRAHLRPYLGPQATGSFLSRVRLADISLKGSQNILPRAERMTNAWGLDMRVPLFDRELATEAFKLPPEMKLHGACEKYVLKRAMRQSLPAEIVWRKKFGMSVPMTAFALGGLAPVLDDLLSPSAIKARGLFDPAFVETLRTGRDVPHEPRRRRVGERLWALAMVEGWMRVFIDGRGKPPHGVRDR